MKTKKILIAGAGISGLSLAVNLKNFNIPFEIIEKQKNWTKKGLAISIQGEGITSAEKSGILKDIKIQGIPRNLKRIENKKGKIIKKIGQMAEDNSFVIPRDILHEKLRSMVSDISMNKEIVKIKEYSDRVDVDFSNGKTDSFSLVVGADGINSTTRNLICNQINCSQNNDKVLYSGSVLWGITIDKKYNEIIEVWDKNSMVAMYPLKEGTVISFFKKAPETFYSSKESRAGDIKKYFSEYSQPDIREALENLPKDIFFDRIRYSRPSEWSSKRITLMGDACHSLSPLSGLGANLAMADAGGLADLINKYNGKEDFLQKLHEFNLNRKRLADEAFNLSKMRTKRGMKGFPESFFRNLFIKYLQWNY